MSGFGSQFRLIGIRLNDTAFTEGEEGSRNLGISEGILTGCRMRIAAAKGVPPGSIPFTHMLGGPVGFCSLIPVPYSLFFVSSPRTQNKIARRP